MTFIREVAEARADAPDMDPGVELFKLRKKFEVWKREFKEKLKTTGERRTARWPISNGQYPALVLRLLMYIVLGVHPRPACSLLCC